MTLIFQNLSLLRSGLTLNVSGRISNLRVEHKVNILQLYAYAAVKGDYDVNVSANFDLASAIGIPNYIELGFIPVAGIGRVSVGVEYSVTGKITLKFGGGFSAGFENIRETEVSVQLEILREVLLLLTQNSEFLLVCE